MVKILQNSIKEFNMVNFGYKLFAAFFNFYRLLFKVNNSTVSLIMVHKGHFRGNLGYIHNELNERGLNLEYNIISKDEYDLSKINSFSDFLDKIMELLKLFLIKSHKLAVSRYIFLNDNFLPMAYMDFNPETTVIQLWHAVGAFKKFGLSTVTDDNLRELETKISGKLDYVIVSSKNVVPFYKEAFGVAEEKVLALGIPRTDFYFQNNSVEYVKHIKNKFGRLYPEIKNKKIVLYAPTFRNKVSIDKDIVKNFNVDLFTEELDEYCLMVRLHPQINHAEFSYSDLINVTDYPDEKELLILADILITDYSSIMIEYALLNKPIIFYPYDYEYYIREERGFYFDYWESLPGPIACTPQELIKIIKENTYDFDKIKEFVKLEFDYLDGKSTQRVINHIIK